MAVRILDNGWRLPTWSNLLWINGIRKKVKTSPILGPLSVNMYTILFYQNLIIFRQDWSRIPGEGDGEYYGEVRTLLAR